MSVRLEDVEIEALCKVVKAALERAGVPEIGEVFAGPRHNEVGFETKDGGHVVMSMRGSI